MRLIACRLRNIRRHQDLQLQFGRQITLISGANETGKSTLVEALHKGLFLRATATGRGVEELRSRLHAGLPELEIAFEASGQRWRLRKRFAGSSGTCQLSNAQGVALSGAAAEEQLASLLGFEAPVEGRRIAQLPERWAHLWVRQGEAGLNPMGGSQESYDHKRLLTQLQQEGGASEALESGVDRLVLERIQMQVGEIYTATGRVKAGSALAEAQRRTTAAAESLAEAQQQLSELEAAMEQWRLIGERLETIDSQQLPLLQRELALQQQTQLLQAKLEPLLQLAREQHQLLAQQQQERQDQQIERHQLEALIQQQQLLGQQREQQHQQLQTIQRQLQQGTTEQEQLQRHLDLRQLTTEVEQLREHQHQLERLQSEAEAIKQQLAGLPEITAEQVKQLRQAEQDLAQASARCEAMAASVEILRSDQTIQLNGDVLPEGERRLIQASTRLQVGEGVVLELCPGGGEALPQALERQRQSQQQLERLQQELGLNSSDAAEAIERQRQSLSSNLANLRQSARTIPWSGLQERLADLEPRLQQLHRELMDQTELMELDRRALELRQQELRRQNKEFSDQQGQLTAAMQQLERGLQQSQASVEASRTRLAQLEGSLTVIDQRLERLRQQQPDDAALEEQQQKLDELLRERSRLQGERRSDAALEIQALEDEKAQLLSQRGQAEQRCSSLGAINPAAELERRQAAWEAAEAERCSLEQRGRALLLLQERFHTAQSNQASRYSEPLKAAMTPYLTELVQQQPLLSFDPQQGFHDLQLNQSGESFAFERLSGGMREQLAAAVRLAMAEVLKPAYDDVLPLVFDDAFTNSDRERLVGLKRMLQRGIAQGIQIILLSCHPADYLDLVEADPLNAAKKNPPDSLEGMDAVSVSLN